MLTQECLQDAVKYGECFIKFGKTAEYIPELARVNKYHLGACIVGLDGTVMEYGDTRTPFTIQSISKLASLILPSATAAQTTCSMTRWESNQPATRSTRSSSWKPRPSRLIRSSMPAQSLLPAASTARIRTKSSSDSCSLSAKSAATKKSPSMKRSTSRKNPLVTATALLPTTSKPPVFWKATSRNVWTFTSRCARSMSLRWTLPR